MNIGLAGSTATLEEDQWGTMHLHPTEVRTRRGLYLAYVSNKRRLDNSNPVMEESNMNFNLHFQAIRPDGTLAPEDNQFAYFTTTSALSPTPLREGLAFSYQATTEDNRLWHIQKLDSEGRWESLTGYGHGDQLFHLGTFCVGDPEQPGLMKDYFVGAKYYNINNEAFGSIWRQDLSKIGKNSYDNFLGTHTTVPRQDGALELTDIPNVSLSHDEPSPKDLVGPYASGNYFGKLTSPRCGGVNELYFAYSPTSANGKLNDYECSRHIYRSEIGFRDDLRPWVPGRTVLNGGHYTIIRRTIPDANLLWVVPIVRWLIRSNGDAEQQYTDVAATQPSVDIKAGEPFAIIGTSALYNTDRRPAECFLRPQRYWHPWGAYALAEENDAIAFNQDTWTWVTGSPGAFCIPPERDEILGVAINLTSNRTNLQSDDGIGYITEGGNNKEAVRLLGVYSVEDQPNEPGSPPGGDPRDYQDQSFLALIPSHVPIELQPLDRRYGMKLADVRSWHSLKPRESRTNCGGCHQHDVLADPVPFDGKYAQGRPPLDMVRHTPSIHYNEHCEVELGTSNLATESYPEWHADIWNGMTTYCGSCHGPLPPTGTGTPEARAALYWNATDYASAVSVYGQINAAKFGNAHLGALGSQLFWAAQGHRTDNRVNSTADFLPDYDCTACGGDCTVAPCSYVTFNKQRYGFHYSSQHNAMGARCTNGDQPYANWVFKVGKWIDNHLPRDRSGTTFPYNFDWYHPTGDIGLSDPACATTALRVGWWDDTGTVASIKVWLNEEPTPLFNLGSRANGDTEPGLPLPPVSSSDLIKLEVVDATGNRQIYRKTVDQLLDECDLAPPGP
jgi:mono/diheme cytochrome c family protein